MPSPTTSLPKTLTSADVCLIVGKRGKGKSHCAKGLVDRMQRAGWRIVVFDYWDEYSKHGRKNKNVTLGTVRERMSWDDFVGNVEVLDDPELSLSVVPSKDEEECAAQFRTFKAILMDYAEEVDKNGGEPDLLIVADELGIYELPCRAELNYIATQSRHYGVPLLYVAQRMIQIPLTARTQASYLVTFRQDNPEDLNGIRSLVGVHHPGFAERVSSLAPREFEVWRDD